MHIGSTCVPTLSAITLICLLAVPFQTTLQSSNDTMSETGATNVDGIGTLTYQRAIDIARSTEGELDHSVKAYLEVALQDIWNRINSQPDTYVMSKDEFAVFNFYAKRFNGEEIARRAIDRYWRHTQQPGGTRG